MIVTERDTVCKTSIKREAVPIPASVKIREAQLAQLASVRLRTAIGAVKMVMLTMLPCSLRKLEYEHRLKARPGPLHPITLIPMLRLIRMSATIGRD